MYTVVKSKDEKGSLWRVIAPDGSIAATFGTKWEADDYAAEMNERT